MHLLNVLMKWEKKKLALEAPKTDKTEESEDAKKEGVKDVDEEMKKEKSEDAKKVAKAEDSKEGEAKAGDVGNKRQQDSWGVITRIQNCDPIAEISASRKQNPMSWSNISDKRSFEALNEPSISQTSYRSKIPKIKIDKNMVGVRWNQLRLNAKFVGVW